MTATLPAATKIRFTVNGRPVAASVDGGRRLLDVLRLDLGLTGSKEGCGEGECGACAVLLDGELVNSCLVPVGQVAGRDVITIEGLATDGRLAPVQASFLELGGTQCGMCAPGMLMAAHALLASGQPSGDPDIREAIAGNLCRCTGYTRIIESIEAVADDGVPGATVVASAAAVAAPGGGLPALEVAATLSLGPAVSLVRPTSLPDALARLAADPLLRPIAGGTDLMVQVAADPRRQRPLLDLSDLDDLRVVTVQHDELVLGALTAWEELRHSTIVSGALPVLTEVATDDGCRGHPQPGHDRRQLHDGVARGRPPPGAPRDGRPAGDRGTGRHAHRCRPMRSGPATGRPPSGPGELLVAIRIPLVPGRQVRFRKVGTRRALSIAKVLVAVAWREDEGCRCRAGRRVRALARRPRRPGFRGRATDPGPAIEAVLEGRVPSPALAAEAAAAVEARDHPDRRHPVHCRLPALGHRPGPAPDPAGRLTVEGQGSVTVNPVATEAS